MKKRLRKKYQYQDLILALDGLCLSVDKIENELTLLHEQVDAHDKYIADDRYLASENTKMINTKFDNLETDVLVLRDDVMMLRRKKSLFRR